MKAPILETQRNIKTRETKEKIIKAARKLLNSYGYDYLTINNICKLAGVSTGSFYHHYANKDAILIHFTREGFDSYLKQNRKRLEQMNALEQLLDLYKWYVCFFAPNGPRFVANYFSAGNLSLRDRRNCAEDIDLKSTLPSIAKTTLGLIKDAQNEGTLSKEHSACEIYYNMDVIMFGVIFEWCLHDGVWDVAERLTESLTLLLNNYTCNQ